MTVDQTNVVGKRQPVELFHRRLAGYLEKYLEGQVGVLLEDFVPRLVNRFRPFEPGNQWETKSEARAFRNSGDQPFADMLSATREPPPLAKRRHKPLCGCTLKRAHHDAGGGSRPPNQNRTFATNDR